MNIARIVGKVYYQLTSALDRIYVALGSTSPDFHSPIGKSTLEETFIISILGLILVRSRGNAGNVKILQRVCHSARIMCFNL